MEDNIKMDLGTNRIHTAHDRDKDQTVVNAIMNLSVAESVESFSTRIKNCYWATVWETLK
jgi:hypothetical protein